MARSFIDKSRLLVLPVCGAAALLLVVGHAATAQSSSGTITGRVMWSGCIRGIPVPMTPDAQAQPGAPTLPGEAQPGAPAQVQPQPTVPDQSMPQPAFGLPAGAVLVAVQGTAVNARTDEAGKFSMSGVPAGQYLTVAAGPVANASAAIAQRPNVFVSGGQSLDIGTLSLGGGSPVAYGFPCRVVPGVGAASGATVPAAEVTSPPAGSGTP